MFGLAWLRARTDARGLLEHARQGVPLWAEGYTTDDNARALLYLALLPEGARDEGLLQTYLAFLLYMQKEDGRFRNGLTPDGRFEDEGEAEDPTGRAVLALAALQSLPPAYAGPAREALLRALPALEGFASLRGRAYALLGLLALREEPFLEVAEALGEGLLRAFRGTEPDWPFPGDLTYANHRPVEALHAYGLAFRRREALALAQRALAFLKERYFTPGEGGLFFDPVGNRFMARGQEKPLFDQQPIEAKCALLAHLRFGERALAETAFLWFHGRNRLQVPLVDAFGPMDGLTPKGPNPNRGAEALLSYLLSWQALAQGVFPRVEEGQALGRVFALGGRP
ncbi:hypothetical protein GCM10007092_07020 [Thermus composti]|uniref:Mannosyltransferase n=1 Tax=Thermus composti TaxID=532059 RepID=A0ABV6Q2M9_9DEIN|nr:mannosyltransferase [Thermus composti]GGM96050.1 hypothetical protein GCM10007092_07020 [Thermus composti]